jgi:hypothetical protein
LDVAKEKATRFESHGYNAIVASPEELLTSHGSEVIRKTVISKVIIYGDI